MLCGEAGARAVLLRRVNPCMTTMRAKLPTCAPTLPHSLKMEAREQQLMNLIGQLQQQVSALSRAQQSTQQQVSVLSSTTAAAATACASRPSAGRQAGQQPYAVSDEDFIKADNEPSDDERDGREVSPRAARDKGKGRPANGDAAAAAGAAAGLQPQPPGGAGGRPNKLTGSTPPAEWEPEVAQLRKELGALAANVVGAVPYHPGRTFGL